MKYFAVFLAVLLVSSAVAQDKVESTTGGVDGLLGACVDAKNAFSGVSNCPLRVSLCKLADYEQEMKRDCPKTCGFC
ncbi:hypothetical protein PRIPAC_72903 [Pristionchus pacificus]|uniref:ShK domain-containing protein n=1 Tax=Pristionchus pacificus TaxID=54126 RepID=A0A454XN70_PRIPA|nr:hypothetical protein PRIPAC_72903 [Pristionchus pacificus]|eukprot:PDM80967.1 ShK domain-containing protein [Pristionchus pacificus]